jgi:hypothetical protein
VKEKYGNAARRVIEGKGLPADYCSQNSYCEGVPATSCHPMTSNLYDEGQPVSSADHPRHYRIRKNLKFVNGHGPARNVATMESQLPVVFIVAV